MSQLGGQQFLFPNKPFTPINVSGIEGGQAVQSLGQTRQGELNRAHDAAMQDKQIQAQQGMQANDLAMQQQQLDLQAEQQAANERHQEWIRSQAELERTKTEQRNAAQGKAAQALIRWREAHRRGDMQEAELADLEVERYQEEYKKANSTLELMGPIQAVFSETMDPTQTREALSTFVNDYLGGRFLSYGALMGALIKGTAAGADEIGITANPLKTLETTTEDSIGNAFKRTAVLGAGLVAGLTGDKATAARGTAKAMAPYVPGEKESRAPAIFAQRVAEAVSIGRDMGKGATDTATLQQLLENVLRAATNPEGADDSAYFKGINDAVNQLTAPGEDGKMGAWSRTELDGMIQAVSHLMSGGTEKLRANLVGEDLQALYQKMEESGGETQLLDMSKYGEPFIKFMNDAGRSWAVYSQALGGKVDPDALNFSKIELMTQLQDGLIKIMDDPTMTPQQYTQAFSKMPQELREQVVHGLIQRSDLFLSRLKQNPEMVRMLQAELQTYGEGDDLGDYGMGAFGPSFTSLNSKMTAKRSAAETGMDRAGRKADQILDRRAGRGAEADLMQQALSQFLQDGGNEADFFRNIQ